jgi:hypothetical protein
LHGHGGALGRWPVGSEKGTVTETEPVVPVACRERERGDEKGYVCVAVFFLLCLIRPFPNCTTVCTTNPLRLFKF